MSIFADSKLNPRQRKQAMLYRPSNGQMDGWTIGWIDPRMNTMFLSYTDVIAATGGNDDNFLTDLAVFTKALRTDRSTD